ncbi:hypothetical protein GCK72_011355 [Caenorhabditis remanei]|uniref:RING-type domain-containing protein n=1 Tax=Caenorhabditis remanei TaxID=31234 RepID=A0A6A5H5J1_CAERE|nr:hypothetical protein GCK72_011355 [Caenorhabditis remanei]KAF1763090.1 hypothetical protein GCK72_011355 [Caenorhabditis remanei]
MFSIPFGLKDVILLFQSVNFIYIFYLYTIYYHAFTEHQGSIGVSLLAGIVFCLAFVKCNMSCYMESKQFILRKYLIIGYGVMTVSGVMAQLCTMWTFQKDISILLFITFSCSIVSFTSIILFIRPYYKDYKMNPKNVWHMVLVLFVTLIIYLLFTATLLDIVRLSVSYENIRSIIIISGILSFLCTVEFAMVFFNWVINQDGVKFPNFWLTNWLVSKKINGCCWKKSSVSTTPQVYVIEERPPRRVVRKCRNDHGVICNMCSLYYNFTTVTPRTLECGHTVCEGCLAKQMIVQEKWVVCPFCFQWVKVLGVLENTV